MRRFSCISLFFYILQLSQALICLQQNDPQHPLEKFQINCSPASTLSSFSELLDLGRTSKLSSNSSNVTPILSFEGLRSPVQSIISGPSIAAPDPKHNLTNMFNFDLQCPTTFSATICADMKQSMYDAGQLISNVVVLTTPIVVNVTLSSFCQGQSSCSDFSDILSLAAAAPARTIPLIDNDNVTRLYPQAVVKQFAGTLDSVPSFAMYDINLDINSDGTYYYSHKGRSIKSSETDFLFIVLHELMHGMGFTSSYEDYFSSNNLNTITPNVLLTSSSGLITFEGFIEYAFDRFFAFHNGQLLTNVVQHMNSISLSRAQNRSFVNTADLTTFISNVTDFVTLSQSLASNFTTAHSITFASPDLVSTNFVVLETSIQPFSSGSSVSHVAADLYANTDDFLMRAYCAKGVTLQQALATAKQNGAQDTEIYGPVGPGLRGVLAALGYQVRGGIPVKAATNLTNSSSISPKSASTSSGTKHFGIAGNVAWLLLSISCYLMNV